MRSTVTSLTLLGLASPLLALPAPQDSENINTEALAAVIAAAAAQSVEQIKADCAADCDKCMDHPFINQGECTLDFWCSNVDLMDSDQVWDLWEGDLQLSSFLGGHVVEGGNDGWLFRLADVALANAGDLNIGGCGVVGDTGCDPVPGPEDCQRMASEGYAQTYWVLRAIAGFQAKLNVMNDYLVSNTLSTLLDIPQIADDFAPPEPPDDGAVLTALLSASLFVLGGVGDIAGVAASFAGAAASAAVAIARSAVAKRPNTDLAAHPKATRIVENAESQAAAAGRFGRGAGAEAASTYIMGSIMSLTSQTLPPAEDNAIDESALGVELGRIFNAAQTRLEQLGRIAVGNPHDGEEYSWLPWSKNFDGDKLEGEGDDPENFIQGFFTDGRMLLSSGNNAFNDTVEGTFGIIKAKIIDMALSSGNVILVDDFRMKEEDCTETGMVWLDRNDGSCFYLKQSSGDENYKDRDEEFYGNLVDKYNFNLADYYTWVFDCAFNGTPEDEEQAEIPPFSDEDPPLCFFNLPAKKYDSDRDGCLGLGLTSCAFGDAIYIEIDAEEPA